MLQGDYSWEPTATDLSTWGCIVVPEGILGKKLGMTRIFVEDGRSVPVTVIQGGPCHVVQKKSEEKDGYNALQLGFEEAKERRVPRPLRGHFRKAGVGPFRHLKEFAPIDEKELEQVELGAKVDVSIFEEGELVDVSGVSKGKGFAGAIKRWNFRRGPMEHGSMYHRRPGALGATDPARVFKGRKLPGRMGGRRVTVRNLRVVQVDPERNLLLVAGAVPGPRGGLLSIKKAGASANAS